MAQETLGTDPDDTKTGFGTETADAATLERTEAQTTDSSAVADEIAGLTDKWKRALADAENARKRAELARTEGREHGIATAVEALAPALDALSLGIEAARNAPDAEDPRIAAHLEGLRNIRAAFETGLKALGVHTIAPEDVPFDPKQHEAMGTQESDKMKPGRVLVLHRPGFAIGNRLIRPARVTVSAAPSEDRASEKKEG
ncbi:nucleotide exchange factor GrpE [Leisingera aquaemixtae]|uniref:Protein GrpE n=1 Tax=Leisingera aquaemixtae TaxID=1396826 RepID=A0A0P1HDM3_9RHOB|nr:nucleotide exchange factor GrpE [Leisingera aquaemixtae]CUI01782.1 HSP-70 cofactor [Leisingera aquaemixtae]